LIIQGETGFFIEPGDKKGLAKQLLFLIKNAVSRAYVGKNAKRFVDENCSMGIISEQLAKLYKKLVQNG